MTEKPNTLDSGAVPLPALREDLTYTVHRQKSDIWYAVQDPRTGKFLRLGRREYLLATAMDGKRPIGDILAALSALDPSLTASEADVQQLAAWLGKAGMLQSDETPTAQMSHRKIVVNLLYTRIPLLSGPLLETIARSLQPLVNRFVIALVVLAWLWGAGSVLLNWDEFTRRASNLFVADGRLWWIAAWLVLKSAHELGHAVMAVKVGSQIRAAGISLIFLAPVPYVDISDLWTISNRWHRVLCSAGGILVELAIAAVAAIVALHTTNESLQYFCCALATMGTLTTVAFNANPLVRFDGYFILSDLIDRPNLWTDGQLAVKRFTAKLFNPFKAIDGPIHPGFLLYGLGSLQYRVVMLASLAIWALLVWQGIGVALVAWGAYGIVIAPWLKQRALARPQQADIAAQANGAKPFIPWLSRERVVGGCIVTTLLAILFCLPSPVQPSAPGVVTLQSPQTLRTETEGTLDQYLVPVGQVVKRGDLIAVLKNSQLELELALKANEVERERESIQAKRARGELAELQSHEAKLVSLQTQLAQLIQRTERLEVRAPVDGTLIQHDLSRQLGKFFKSGTPLGLIATPGAMEVHLSASQKDAERMRECLGSSVEIRLMDGSRAFGRIEKVEPRCTDVLHEPQLAAIYGGSIAVELSQDEAGNESLKLLVPRFDVLIQPEASHTRGDNFWNPGQTLWVRVPGNSSTLWDGFRQWADAQWSQFQRQLPHGT